MLRFSRIGGKIALLFQQSIFILKLCFIFPFLLCTSIFYYTHCCVSVQTYYTSIMHARGLNEQYILKFISSLMFAWIRNYKFTETNFLRSWDLTYTNKCVSINITEIMKNYAFHSLFMRLWQITCIGITCVRYSHLYFAISKKPYIFNFSCYSCILIIGLLFFPVNMQILWHNNNDNVKISKG